MERFVWLCLGRHLWEGKDRGAQKRLSLSWPAERVELRPAKPTEMLKLPPRRQSLSLGRRGQSEDREAASMETVSEVAPRCLPGSSSPEGECAQATRAALASSSPATHNSSPSLELKCEHVIRDCSPPGSRPFSQDLLPRAGHEDPSPLPWLFHCNQ